MVIKMATVNERRINFNPEDYEILKELQRERQFEKLQLMDLFGILLIFGKKQGFRTPLDKKKSGKIRQTTIDNSNVHYLMMAIAVEETKSFEILADRNDYFTICEEYAKTGITFLRSEYIKDPKNFLDKLEFEALKYFDNFIGED